MARDEKLRVIFTGGGSGGHVYPLLAVAEALQKRLIELHAIAEFIYMGPKDNFSTLFANKGFTMVNVMGAKMRRYFSLENVLDMPKFFLGFFQALFELYFIMPDVIFSKGGTGSLPVVVAGWFYRIPVVIHESDAQPGLSNLQAGRFAKKIFVSFDRATQFFRASRTEVIGAPIRNELLTASRTTKELAKETLGFDSKEPLVLVIGGSQGSTRINDFILANLPTLIRSAQVLHQTGVANFADAQKLSRAALIDLPTQTRYQPVNYLDQNMAAALTAADVLIARSGSSTIFEAACFGLPAIYIPLVESANGHQRINAYEAARVGAAVVVEEPNLMPGIFFGQLNTILSSPDLQAKMSAAALQFFKQGAAEKIAETILQLGA